MNTRIATFLDFFERKEGATSVALCRIGIGLTLCLHALRLLTSGTAQLTLTHVSEGGLGIYHGALRAVGGATPQHVNMLVLALAISGAVVALGLMTRASLFASWTLLQMVSALNPDAQGDYDRLLSQSLFLLIWSGCEKALSLDKLLIPKLKTGEQTVAVWPRVLIVFHLALLYAGSAMAKISLSWLPVGDGTALWHLAHHPLWVRAATQPLSMSFFNLSRWMTFGIWTWELTWPIWFVVVWLPRQNKRHTLSVNRAFMARAGHYVFNAYLVTGLLFHVLAECFTEIGPFSFAMLSLYFCCLKPTAWQRIGARLTRFWH